MWAESLNALSLHSDEIWKALDTEINKILEDKDALQAKALENELECSEGFIANKLTRKCIVDESSIYGELLEGYLGPL